MDEEALICAELFDKSKLPLLTEPPFRFNVPAASVKTPPEPIPT